MQYCRLKSVCFLLILLPGLNFACTPQTPESLARERLRKKGVLFDNSNPYLSAGASISLAHAGHSPVVVPHYTGGDSDRGWTDADFKLAVSDLRMQSDVAFLILGLTQITDASMGDVASLQQVRHLDLCMTKVTDDGIKRLSTLKNLEGLYLDSSQNITGIGLLSLNLIQLRYLSLRGTSASDDNVIALNNATKLEYLDLGGTDIGDKTLHLVSKLPVLKTLLLDRTAITDEGVQALLLSSTLEELVLCFDPYVRSATIRELCKLPRLGRINVVGTGITQETVGELRQEYPDLKIIWNEKWDATH